MSDATLKKVNHSLDGQGVNSIRNFQLDTVDTDPDSTKVNQLTLNTVDKLLKYHDGRQLRTVALLSDLAPYVRNRGTHDASGGTVPTAASSTVMPGDSIKEGDKWLVTVGGEITGIGGESDKLTAGDFLVATVNDASAANEFVAVNTNIDTTYMASVEEATLSLTADTPLAVTASNLAIIDSVNLRDANGIDISSSVLVAYSTNGVTLQSSADLTGLTMRMIGRASVVSTGGGGGGG